jgi:glycogen debranching enzyme
MRLDIDGRSIDLTDRAPQEEWPAAIGRDRSVPLHTLKDDDLFLITDTLGNFSGEPQGNSQISMGLFCRDTRYLSRLELQIEGRSPILLSSNAEAGSSLTVLCTNPDLGSLADQPELPQIPAETLGIRRELALQGGLFEEIHITNHHVQTATVSLSLSVGADFFDLFEVRGWQRNHRGKLFYPIPQDPQDPQDSQGPASLNTIAEPALSAPPQQSPQQSPQQQSSHQQSPQQSLVLAYEGLDGLMRSSWVHFTDHPPHYRHGSTAVWDLTLEPQAAITLAYRVQLFAGDRAASAVLAPHTLSQSRASERLELEQWQDQIPHITTDNQALNHLLQRGVKDLYLLRQTIEDRTVLAAGVPWFSTLFGRDALIAASQTLLLDPRIARDTLLVLAQYQGQTDDEWRDEEPGKIMHEIRYGEMARCREVPHTPYYGTVDATPLWLLLYAEYWAWTAHHELCDRLWPQALAAMDWIDRQCEATGYLAYSCRSKRGLVNQGWKDSGNCIVDRQGNLATGSIALSEVQGYVYAAKLHLSEMARSRQQHERADLWQTQARDLKTRFNRDFWMPDEDFCALALDGEGKRVDSITSNPGSMASSMPTRPNRSPNDSAPQISTAAGAFAPSAAAPLPTTPWATTRAPSGPTTMVSLA